MKKLSFIYIVCLCATLQTNAQMSDTTSNVNLHKVDANSLLQKSKKQKTTAWILLGGGACIFATTVIITLSDGFLSLFDLKKDNNRGVLLAAGGAVMLGSIPFFIASGNNKRKANFILKNENVFFNPQLKIKEHLIALGVKINL